MIKNPFIKYLNRITFFSIGVCFVIMLLWLTPVRDYLRSAPYYISMYYTVTLLFWIFLKYAPQKQIIKFEQAYMISKVGKILIYAIIFAVVLLFGIEKSTKFAFAYLTLYLIYTVFDTITIMYLVKEHKNENNEEK
ncbi:MAG: hypothetical protein ACTTJH_04165 [Bacteroidales bacterium]